MNRKAIKVLIEDIGTEDGSMVVDCQLHTGKATVTFRFNCDLDSAHEITENLVSFYFYLLAF